MGKIDKPKGGLDIRRTEDMNATFLAKQSREVLAQPDNVWVRTIKAKYLNNNKDNFLVLRKGILPHQPRRAY